jgi:hypothetical protein
MAATDRTTFAPLVLFRYPETPDRWCLMLSDHQMILVNDVFEAHGAYGNGYSWTGVARSAVRSRAPELADQIDYDPEGGTFVAHSTDPAALRRLGAILRDAFHSRVLLAELVRSADPEELD